MAPVYATKEDLAEYLEEDTAPDNAAHLLKRASLLVDGLLIGASYNTDTNEQPTDASVADALLDATVIQAAYWHHNGLPDEGAGRYGSVSIGSVSLSRGEGAPSAGSFDGQTVAPGVRTVLQLAGLVPVRPQVVG
ncbi:hypothetical protein SAMN06265360_10626 [Haloechinothrix alba]|uniref:Uncharacterized protein n=1 Tax=Haloechinothrix alba TaxID=664784 RepID=A0A238WC74_9PSEU|nr:hypothetical protein [Haloechinothrix alba]SNR44152.1 hypothetical protein SAMN06265360_10626 [Haloechinothrix alba]